MRSSTISLRASKDAIGPPEFSTEPQKAAKRFLAKAIGRNGTPEKINFDQRSANAAAIVSHNPAHRTEIHIRKCKYLNHIVVQDHRSVKRIRRPMMGFKSFDAGQNMLAGIEWMRLLRKGQMEGSAEDGDFSAADQFYALAS